MVGLLNSLMTFNNSCIIEINNGTYIDTNNTGLFGMSKVQSSIKLQNGIIAGAPCEGRTALLDTLAFDAVNNGRPVIYVNNSIGNINGSKFIDYIYSCQPGSNALIISVGQYNSTGINLLKGMDLKMVSDCIIDMMPYFMKVDDNLQNFAVIFLDKLYEILKLTYPRKKFSLLNLPDYDFEWLNTEIQSLYKAGIISKTVKQSHESEIIRLSKIFTTQMMLFQSFAKQVVQSGLAAILSGKNSFKEFLNPGKVLMVSLDYSHYPKVSECFLKLLLQRASLEESINAQSGVYIFENFNMQNAGINFLNLLSICQKKNCGGVYFTETNITGWSSAQNQSRNTSGTHPAMFCNSFFVFKQNAVDERRYWSALSGATKKTEITRNEAPMASVFRLDPNSWTSFLFGNKMVHSGNSIHEVDTYQVEEQQIDRLDEKSCIVIIKTQGLVYNRQVSWS